MQARAWWMGWVACSLVACSSSTPQDTRCTDATCVGTATPPPQGATSQLPNAGSGGPAPAGSFNNPNPGPSGVEIIANPTTTDPRDAFVSTGECMVGQFCPGREADSDVCGTLTFESEQKVTRHPGNVLLVFDRSQSMGDLWNGQARWQAAGAAIQRALEPLTPDIAKAAAVFFPTPGEDGGCIDPTGIACIFVPLNQCGVGASMATQHIDFRDGATFLTTFQTPDPTFMAMPYAPVPLGFTPLMEGLQQAQNALQAIQLDGQTVVVVVTDGEPNCMWNAATANQIVSGWYSQGISTHVIGLPGIAGLGPQLLNQLAQAGGTNQYITPQDPGALETALRMIVSETVKMGFDSCDISLNPAVTEREKLLMIASEPGIGRQNVPKDFGWTLNPDGTQVTLSGPLCDDAKRGRFSEITFEYGCPDVPVPPPLPPIE